ncbi:MAG: SGNH/GDSL hydrolase family protein, partial [Candidatus Deferrimicrobiaceae bacterium]
TPATNTTVVFENQTLRQIVRTSIGGKKVRVRLTNALGIDNLVIGAAHIALRAHCDVIPNGAYPAPPIGSCTTVEGSAIVPSSDRTLFFGGVPSIIIPPGGMVLSDPVKLDVPELGDLAISIYLPNHIDNNTNLFTRHGSAFQTNYVSPAGDHTGAVSFSPLSTTTLITNWYFLSGVEVKAPKETGAIVTLGDSITDGTRSTPNTNNRWPNQLARRLLARPGNHEMGVLDVGISGNRILSGGSTNPVAASRLERDVLTQPGVEYVIVLEGINDSSTTILQPEKIIAGLNQIIERAHERGLTIYGATLTPAGQPAGTPNIREQNRLAVNAWIRTSGAFDDVIDFDEVTRDPSNPTFFLPIYDSGDHLHPNDVGYQAMGNAIDLRLFRNGEGHH